MIRDRAEHCGVAELPFDNRNPDRQPARARGFGS